MDHNAKLPSTTLLSGHQNPNSYVLNGKIMLCSVIILFVAVIFLVCFHSYARWLFQRHHRHGRAHQLLFLSTTSTNTNIEGRVTVVPQALDLCVLKTIPTFVYSSNIHDKQLECAVCLSEFEDNEKGRVLPKCKHAFHVDCIGMWFHSHSNCPLCRTTVEPNIPVHSPAEVVSATEPACSIIEREEGEMGCSSSSLPPLELVSILVEIPRGDFRGLDDMGLRSLEGNGFKSPGNRVLPLKRIWSI